MPLINEGKAPSTTPHPDEPTSEELCRLIVEGMVERKAQRILVLDLRGLQGAVTDYFVICSGQSVTQVDAITDSIEKHVSEQGRGVKPWAREGKANKEWILLDYSDCVVHVFQPARREFYALEQLWGDAPAQWYDETGRPVDDDPARATRPTGRLSA